MFWGVLLCIGIIGHFWFMDNPDMQFRPGIVFEMIKVIWVGREVDEVSGKCPGAHKLKELNRWNILIFLSGFIFIISLGLRALIAHEDEEGPNQGKVIYTELFLALGEMLGSYLFGYYYHKRGISISLFLN
jgi:hypothetical protein